MLGEIVEVVRHGSELVAVFLGDDHQAPGPPSDRVRQSPCQVVVIAAVVLVLDDELRTVLTVSDDVDTPPTAGRHLGLAQRREVDTDRRSDLVDLLGQQGSEVRSLTGPGLPEASELKPSHRLHGAPKALGRQRTPRQ